MTVANGGASVAGAGGGAADGGVAGSSSTSKGGGGSTGDGGTAGAPIAGGASGGLAGSGSAGERGGFHDSFEDGTLEPWASGPEGDSMMTDEAAANGSTRSLRVPGGVYYYAGSNVTFEPIAATYVSWWIRFTGATPSKNGVAHFALSADGDAVDKLLQIWAAPEGFIIDGGLPGSNGMVGGSPPAPDTWYHLELSIDWTIRAVSLRVDGDEVLDNALVGTGEGITRVDLFTVEPATSYFDEIEIVP